MIEEFSKYLLSPRTQDSQSFPPRIDDMTFEVIFLFIVICSSINTNNLSHIFGGGKVARRLKRIVQELNVYRQIRTNSIYRGLSSTFPNLSPPPVKLLLLLLLLRIIQGNVTPVSHCRDNGTRLRSITRSASVDCRSSLSLAYPREIGGSNRCWMNPAIPSIRFLYTGFV